MDNFKAITAYCSKCKRKIIISDFVEIVSIIQVENDKDGIKHLLSMEDLCPECHTLFSIKLTYVECQEGGYFR